MSAPRPNSEDGTAGAVVSEQLKVLFAQVVSADLPPDDKGRWHKRLIAITNTSKHDVVRAAEQLTRFQHEWNGIEGGTGMSNNDADR